MMDADLKAAQETLDTKMAKTKALIDGEKDTIEAKIVAEH